VTKADLIAVVAEDTQQNKALVEKVINSVLDQIAKALSRNEKVQLTGFGTFEARQRKARTGRNLQTKEVIQIPARRVPAFSAGKALKDKVA